MTAAGPMVLVLIGVALLVAVIFVLVAVGRIPLSLQAPDNPWWAARRRRRRAAQQAAEDESREQPTDL